MKTLAIIRREYLERVRTKGFLISTLAIPLLMSLVMVIPMLTMDNVDADHTQGVIDADGTVYPALEKLLLERERMRILLVPIAVGTGLAESDLEELRGQVRDEQLDAGLVVGPDFTLERKLTFYSKSVAAGILRDEMLPDLRTVLRTARFADAGVADSLQAYLTAGVIVDDRKISDDGEESSRDEAGVFALAFTLIMMLYMMVITYGQQTLTGVIEEKTSRVVEIILSSVSSRSLMLGKIIGIGAAGLTQVAIWATALTVLSGQGVSVAGLTFDSTYLTPLILGSFGVFFVLGFLMFSTMYAGVGALCNSVQESQQFAFPVMMFAIIPMMLLTLVLRAPDSGLATGLSLFPLFSPILMFIRVCLSTPPMWQVLLSWALMIATTWALSRVAGKLFRVGILVHGAAPSWGTLMKVLRQPD